MNPNNTTRFTLCMAMVALLGLGVLFFPQTVQATNMPDPPENLPITRLDVSKGSYTLDKPGVMYILYGNTTKNTVTVKGGSITAPIYFSLQGVNMDLSGAGKSPVSITNDSYAVCFLAYGENPDTPSTSQLKGGSKHAGLFVSTSAFFVLRCEDTAKPERRTLNCSGGSDAAGIGGNDGTSIRGLLSLQLPSVVKVNATGGANAAGIGGGADGSVDNLIIDGGIITATGGADGAGIGGGDSEGVGGTGGHCYGITIRNAQVTAITPQNAAAIGAGKDKSAENIYIDHSTVFAESKQGGGAAIGGGYDGSATSITITGNSNVTALSHGHGAAIGGGTMHGASDIHIMDSVVEAKISGLESNGAAIGGGADGSADNIVITNSTINAQTGNGAGIGSGSNGSASQPGPGWPSAKNITIKSSTVKAAAHTGAGIGTGVRGNTVDGILISGSTVVATSSSAAGIGHGLSGHAAVKNITIENSQVSGNAIAGATWGGVGTVGDMENLTIRGSTVDVGAAQGVYNQAGIGSGVDGIAKNITIENSTIKARGGHGAAGIGGGGLRGIGNVVGFGNAENIVIQNSDIQQAEGKAGGAGIGGGTAGDAKGITIVGSTVHAYASGTSSSAGAAGIGGGHSGSAYDVRIERSDVQARVLDGKGQTGYFGAGIGSSGAGNAGDVLYDTEVKRLTILNSSIDAAGGQGGAGIGGGWGSSMNGPLEIGGDANALYIVRARGGEGAAGIGAGRNGGMNHGGDGNNISITGNVDVEATGGTGGAGIGGGWGGDASHLTLSATRVKAVGGAGAAGVGAGAVTVGGIAINTPKKGSDIRIAGHVEAHGGAEYRQENVNYGGGAGIGGGNAGGDFSNIVVEGGNVTAHAGGNAAGIGVGGGTPNGRGGTLTITGGQVWASSLVVGSNFDAKLLGSPGKAIISGGTITVRSTNETADKTPYFTVDGGNLYFENGLPARLPKNSFGDEVFQVAMKVPGAQNAGQPVGEFTIALGNSTLPYGSRDIYTRSDGAIYVFLPVTPENDLSAQLKMGSVRYQGYQGTSKRDNTGVLTLPLPVELSAGAPGLSGLVAGDATVTATLGLLQPDSAEIGAVAYQSSNSAVATVDAAGVVTAHALGSYTVTATVTPADSRFYRSGTASLAGNVSREKGSLAIVGMADKEYDGQPVENPAVQKNGDGAVSYSYNTADGQPPKDAGSYTVTATMAETSRTTAASATASFTIYPRATTSTLSARNTGADSFEVKLTVYNALEALDPAYASVGLDDTTPTQSGPAVAYDADSKVCTFTYGYRGAAAGTNYTVSGGYSPAGGNYGSSTAAPILHTLDYTDTVLTVSAVPTLHYGTHTSLSLTVTATEANSGNVLANRTVSGQVVDALSFAKQSAMALVSATAITDSSGNATFTLNIQNAGAPTLLFSMPQETNYNGALASRRVLIERAPLTVTPILEGSTPAVPPPDGETLGSRVYGAGNPAFALHYEGLAPADTKESVATAFDFGGGEQKGSLVAESEALTTSGVGSYNVTVGKSGLFVSRNYDITYQTARLEITPAQASVLAENASSTYGEPLAPLQYRYEGLQNGDGEELAGFGQAAISTAATASSDAGEYPITLELSGLSSPNYTFTKTDALYTVTKASVPLSVQVNSKIYDSAPVEPRLTENKSGQTVEYLFWNRETGETEETGIAVPIPADATPSAIGPPPYTLFSQAPAEAGQYALIGYVPPSTNYTGGYTAPVPFFISKAYPFAQIEASYPSLSSVLYLPDKTLSSVMLPAGWHWLRPERPLQLGAERAFAVFTPADTRNYTLGGSVLQFAVTEPGAPLPPLPPPVPDTPIVPPAAMAGAVPTGDGNETADKMVALLVCSLAVCGLLAGIKITGWAKKKRRAGLHTHTKTPKP